MHAKHQFAKKRVTWVIYAALAVLLAAPLFSVPSAQAQAGAISGTVTDPEGLLPPAGTVVRLLKPDHTTFGQANVDPGSGAFGFNAVPNGNYILRAIPPDGTPYTHSQPVPVSVLGAPVDVGTVPLTNPSITGMVYAPDGVTPTPAWLHLHSGGRWVQRTAAPDGHIQLGGLPAGTYRLQASPMGDDPYWQSDPLDILLTSGTTQTVSLTLTAADVIGRAVDASGAPVKEAVARVHNNEGRVVCRGLTTVTGHFALGGLAEGAYTLTLEAPWWAAGLLPPAPVPFGVPPQQDLGPIAFQTSPKVVHGTVETNTGTPVQDALIDAHRMDKSGHVHAVSGVGGHYTINLSEGLWTLDVKPISTTVPADWVYLAGPQLVHFQHNTQPEAKVVNFQVVTADSRVTGVVEMPGGGVPPFTITVGIHTDAGLGRTQDVDPSDGSFDIRVPHGAYKVNLRVDDPEYVAPNVDPIRVLPNAVYDLGTLTLEERDATISGTVTNGTDPVADIPVIAWRRGGPGWAHTHTGPDGTYVLSVVGGTWLVKPAPTPEQGWLYAGEAQEVEVPAGGELTAINFALTATNARIAGSLVDESGTLVTTVSGWAHATNTAEPAMQKGAPIEDGTFELLVPAGTYRLDVRLPEGASWLAPGAQEVTVSSGETAPVTLTLRAKDAALAGALWDSRNEVTVTGVDAGVMAFSQGSWVGTAVNTGNGAYRLDITPGLWTLGYKVDKSSKYVALRHRKTYPVASGQTVPAPLPVAEKDGLLRGTVLDPDGAPLGGASIVVDGLGAMLQDVHLGTVSEADGTFVLRVPHGHFLVRASLGDEHNWLNPASKQVVVPRAGSVNDIVLQFQEPDAVLSGLVTLEGGGPTGTAHIWAYSSDDAYAKTMAELGTVYSLDVISNTTWHVGAAFQEGNNYWWARARVEVPPEGAVQDLELNGPFPLPAPVTVGFDASQEQYVEVADGTTIYIPAGAMPVSGTVTLHITPIATFPHQRHANVYRYGYAFTAADSNGQPIEEAFDQDVLVTFPYDEAELQAMGLSEYGLKPAYFSTTTDSWTFPETFVVDTDLNRVAMQIDHFTDFALTGSVQAQVYLPLVAR